MPFYLGRKAIRRVPGAVIKAAPLPQPELIEGFGKRALVGELCKKAEYGSVLLVTDETLFSLGLHEKVMASLDAHRIPYTIFHDINGEPTVRMVDAGRRAAMAVHCHVAAEGDGREAAADSLILALKGLLDKCGLEKGCKLLDEKDYDQLTAMIDADSINYSPCRTFSDSEIRMPLDQIRRGY